LSFLVFAFRMVAWWRQWRVPAPVRSWTVRDLDVLRRRERSVFGRPRREGSSADDRDHERRDDDEGRDRDDDADPDGLRDFRPGRRR
jgi:hypothetical protein